MATLHAEVVKSAGHFHSEIGKAGLRVAEHIFDDSAPFDTCNGVFNHYACAGDDFIQPAIRRAQLLAFSFFWAEK